MKPSRWTRIQGAATIAVTIAAVAVAIVNPGSSSDATPTTQSVSVLGREICQGFQQATISQYRETARTLPDLQDEATRLIAAPNWQAVGTALTDLTRLGPTKAWTASRRRMARDRFRALQATCRPHLR